jgi:hypothetical protein
MFGVGLIVGILALLAIAAFAIRDLMRRKRDAS